jgi:hypothetical protein
MRHLCTCNSFCILLFALVNAVMNLRVPQNVGNLSSGYTIGGLSSSSQFHRVSLVILLLWPLE